MVGCTRAAESEIAGCRFHSAVLIGVAVYVLNFLVLEKN